MSKRITSASVSLISPPNKWIHHEIPYPPLGIAYLSAVAKKMGIKIRVVDYQFPENEAKLFEIFNHKGPQLIGISATLMQLPDSVDLARKIKSRIKNAIVLFGGAGPNCLSTKDFFKYSSGAVDLVCQGEGEATWAEILSVFIHPDNRSQDYLKSEILFKNIPGIAIFAKDSIIQNPSRALITDLDTIPMPDLESIESNRYVEMWGKNSGVSSISIFPSRGCPYNCVFCDKTIFGRNFRHHSPKRIVDEMERILSLHKSIDDIFLFDDNLATKREIMVNMCQEIKKRELKVSWSCQARVNSVDLELLQIMHDSGCQEIYFGVDAATPKLLKYLGKGINIDQAVKAVTWSREVGMRPGCFFIVGIPTETREDIEAIATFIWRAKPSYVGFSVLIPFPGTKLYEVTKKLIRRDLATRFELWDDTRSTIYKSGTFEIDPKISLEYLEGVFKDMLAKEKVMFNTSQFVIDRYD